MELLPRFFLKVIFNRKVYCAMDTSLSIGISNVISGSLGAGAKIQKAAEKSDDHPQADVIHVFPPKIPAGVCNTRRFRIFG